MKFIIRTLFAVFLFAGPAANAGSASDDYILARGDKITIKVFGQAELSGDFLIDGQGNIQIPLLGEVPAAGGTVEDCRRRVSDGLADGLIKKPAVSVRISELRPIYVIGDVKTPGAYPFRFGLSMSAAVALAGGLGPMELRQSSALTDLLSAEERVKILNSTHNALIVRLARLEAERADQKTFAPPKTDDPSAGSAIEALMHKEQIQLTAAIAAHEEATKLLQLQKPRLQSQMQEIKNEIVSTTRQLQVNKDFLKGYEKLSASGYSKNLTELELQRQATLQQENIYRLQAELSRLEVTIGDLDIRLQDAERVRQARIMNEIRENQTRLQETEISLASARQILEVRRTQAGVVTDMRNLGTAYEVRLVRHNTGRPEPVLLSKDTAIEPGDTIEVRRILPKENLPGANT